MAFSRINSGGWSTGQKLTSAQITALDIDHANALDKTTAGDTLSGAIAMSASTARINVSGSAQINANNANAINANASAGITANALASIESTVTAGIQSNAVGGINSNIAAGIQSGAVGGIQLSGGSSDWPTFSSNRNRVVTYPVAGALWISTNWTQANFPFGILGTASASFPASIPISHPHHGSTIASVTMFVAVGTNHTGVPTNLPAILVQRVSSQVGVSYGASIDDLATTTRQAFPTPGSGSAWTASNEIQSWTYTTSQNNVVDTSQYAYYIVLYDENGTNAISGSNIYPFFQVHYTNIANMAFP